MKWRILLLAAVLACAGHMAAAQMTVPVTNSGTGTTNGLLAKLTGAPSTAVTVLTSDTGGAIGVVVSGGGTTGTAIVGVNGIVSCTFDGAGVVANHYVQISATTAGNCKDGGASYPASGQVVGMALQTIGSSGPANMVVFPPPGIAGASGASTSANNTFTGTNTFSGSTIGPAPITITTALTVDSTITCGALYRYNSASPANATVNTSFPAGCSIGIEQLSTGAMTVVAGTGTVHSPCTTVATNAQYAVISVFGEAAGTALVGGRCT